MNILALETSCEQASVALSLKGEVVDRQLVGHANHSEHILPTIRHLVAEAGIPLGELDAIAFGSGPGAFTGLRLSCGVAQGLAMGADIGVLPICSLDILSMQSAGEQILVATDARMGEVYAASYLRENGWPIPVVAPVCLVPTALRLAGPGPWSGIGSAFRVHADNFAAEITQGLVAVNGDAVPRARDLLQLARHRLQSEALLPPELAAPIYVRNKVALTTAERLARGGRA